MASFLLQPLDSLDFKLFHHFLEGRTFQIQALLSYHRCILQRWASLLHVVVGEESR